MVVDGLRTCPDLIMVLTYPGRSSGVPSSRALIYPFSPPPFPWHVMAAATRLQCSTRDIEIVVGNYVSGIISLTRSGWICAGRNTPQLQWPTNPKYTGLWQQGKRLPLEWGVARDGSHIYNHIQSKYRLELTYMGICSKKLHLQSYVEMLCSKTGYFGLLGNNHILFIILLYIIKG